VLRIFGCADLFAVELGFTGLFVTNFAAMPLLGGIASKLL
jgi:hypothetical protein